MLTNYALTTRASFNGTNGLGLLAGAVLNGQVRPYSNIVLPSQPFPGWTFRIKPNKHGTRLLRQPERCERCGTCKFAEFTKLPGVRVGRIHPGGAGRDCVETLR